ncbi:MAG: hypothetical protein J0L64_24405, partial [Acidobacteria bacterium]|nr:hypothetical protein [Acidobacteriota bacterium]
MLPADDITGLLQQWSEGDQQAFDQLVPIVYGELRQMAEGFFRREGDQVTLQPTALVHELYLRLVDQKRAQWRDREQFFGIAAKMMRRILVDLARQRSAGKRGAGALHLPIEDALDRPLDEGRAVLAIGQRRMTALERQQPGVERLARQAAEVDGVLLEEGQALGQAGLLPAVDQRHAGQRGGQHGHRIKGRAPQL